VTRRPDRARAVVALFLFVAVASGCASLRPASGPAPKNLIVFIGDGVGASQLELARQASMHLRREGLAITDVIFRRGSVGLMTTHARDTLLTDSAAAATAMSTGVKTRDGMIAITPEGERLATAMQSAQLRGKRIGLVTTARVSDATPAAFSVHATSRGAHESIVTAYLGLQPDVLLGGGAAWFLPDTGGGRRRDGRDVITEFRDRHYTIVRSQSELATATSTRLLGLFADDDLDHEVDRPTTSQPSLAEMTDAALRVLAQDPSRGFVLLVESEATDTAGHANDVAALIQDVWAFDRAVKVGLAFQERAPAETLVIVAGDHETGGLSPTLAPATDGRGVVVPSPEKLQLLAGITTSFNRAARMLGRTPTEASIDGLVVRYFPGFTLDPELRRAIRHQEWLGSISPAPTQGALARMVAQQTGLYWATAGHTADPVAVGALGPGAELFRGWFDNTDFGRALHRLIAGLGRP
jgi:alkaline phosphatase